MRVTYVKLFTSFPFASARLPLRARAVRRSWRLAKAPEELIWYERAVKDEREGKCLRCRATWRHPLGARGRQPPRPAPQASRLARHPSSCWRTANPKKGKPEVFLCLTGVGDTYRSLILAVDSVVGTFLSVLEGGVAFGVVVGFGRSGLDGR